MKVIVNGTFDVLHIGHILMLESARITPSTVVKVLIDSDRRVASIKGSTRPVNTAFERATLLMALRHVDQVVIFDSDEELINEIKNFKPDVMIKGSDYRGRHIIGADYCKEIKFYERHAQYSSTKKIQDIINRGLLQ